MGKLAVGDVVAIAFPFSDLTALKKRPAVVVAHAENSDVILCQITSCDYSNRTAIPIQSEDFTSGGLPVASFVRPSKLFTASESIALAKLGTVTDLRLHEICSAIAALFTPAEASS